MALDAVKLLRTAKEHIFDKPRRLAWVTLGLVLFFITHGSDAWKIVQVTIKLLRDKKWADWTLGLLIDTVWNVGTPLVWLCACFFGAFAFSHFFHRYLISEIAPGAGSPDRQRFLLEGMEQAGLFRVYRADLGMPIVTQPYADRIRACLGTASRMRMLTIAGYEYVGKGSESLLWDGIRKRPDLNVEVVLLHADCDAGKAVIESRVQCLASKDPHFDQDQMVEHIGKTKTLLRKMKASRGNQRFEVKLLAEHPLFRILILDDDMWVSAYESANHGHESKVFHFRRSGPASWFHAFESMYDQAAKRAENFIT
jgi:hypothetical protein